MLKRKENWRVILDREIVKRRGRKFSFGRHDCCFAVSSILYAMTGVGIHKELGTYRSRAGAMEKLDEFGGVEKLAEHFAEKYGIAEVKVSYAQAGDVVLCDSGTGEGVALGIVCLDARTYVSAADVGWCLRPLSTALRVWRI